MTFHGVRPRDRSATPEQAPEPRAGHRPPDDLVLRPPRDPVRVARDRGFARVPVLANFADLLDAILVA
jgi:hypothetical protein